jgi:spermidine synthase
MNQRLIIWLLAFVTGFLSLSLEIIWIRVVDFTRHGQPDTFGFVLSAFLVGIALGAFAAGRLVLRKGDNVFRLTSYLLILTAFFSYLSIPLVAEIITVSYQAGFLLCLLLIALVACAYGMIFPLLCHAAAGPTEPAGRSVSYVYFANILGATLSPLLTGLYFFDHFSLSAIVAGIAVMSAMTALVLFAISSHSKRKTWIFLFAVITFSIFALQTNSVLYQDIYAKLLYKNNWHKKQPFKYVVENRSGLITVEASKYGGDVIYGGGVWDGRFYLDPVFPISSIDRAYLVSAIHRQPREVLEIGLSSGSWALVLDAYEPIESLDIVEINHGYPEVIRHYPQHRRLFDSDKANLHFDDGRRWLNRNPARTFDLVVMNTSWHERNNITNLLSADFLQIVKSHLKPDGVIYYNTTNSEDAIYTAAQIFKHIVRYQTFIAASDSPFNMSEKEARSNIQKFIKEPMKSMYQTRIHPPLFQRLAATPLDDIADDYRNKSDLVVITDDNMATEFRRTSPKTGVPWASFLKKVWQSS